MTSCVRSAPLQCALRRRHERPGVRAPAMRVAYLQLAARGRAVRPDLAGHQDRPRGQHAGLARRAARASLSAITAFVLLAALGRLHWPQRADWPIVLSVGAFQLTLLLRPGQSRPAERAARPLGRAGLHGHAVDGAAVAAGRRTGRLARPRRRRCSACWASSCWSIRWRFDWTDRRHRRGPCLAAAGGSQLGRGGPACAAPSLARLAARGAALADVGGDDPAVAPGARPRARRASRFRPGRALDGAGLSSACIAGPTGTWAAVSVARALPPVTGRSACWARRCSPSPRRSSWSASPMTWPAGAGHRCW